MPLTKINNRSLSGQVTNAQVPTLETSKLPSKTILQTRTAVMAPQQVSTSSDANTSTGLTIPITPVAAGSSFIVTMAGGQQTYGNGGQDMVALLYWSNPTGATPAMIDYIAAINQSSTYHGTWSVQKLHTPSSYTLGNEITYHIYMRCRGGGGTVHFQWNTGGLASPICLRVDEIKA